jgi:hypothetical protein
MVTVPILRALEALEPDLRVGDIVQMLNSAPAGSVPRATLGAYGMWQAEVIIDTNPPGNTVAAIQRTGPADPNAGKEWAAELTGKTIPIDMGLWPA